MKKKTADQKPLKLVAFKFQNEPFRHTSRGLDTDDAKELEDRARSIHRILWLADNENDAYAAQRAVEHIMDSVEHLNQIARKKPQLFADHAKNIDTWPVLFNLRPECVPWAQKLVTKLGVGSARSLKGNQKTRSRLDDYLTLTAIRLIEHVSDQRWFLGTIGKQTPVDESKLAKWAKDSRELPELSKTTFDRWWPVLRDAFNEGCPEPENDPKLIPYVSPEYRESPASRIRDLLKRKAKSLVA